MNGIIRFAVYLVVSIFIIGCAVGSRVVNIEAPTLGKGVVYLYRPANIIGFISCPSFSLNGKGDISLSNGGAVRLELAPGSYTIAAKNKWCWGVPIKIFLNVHEGEIRYIKLHHSMKYQPGAVKNSEGYTVLEEIKPEMAISELQETRL